MLPEELKQLIAARAPAYVEEKRAADAVSASDRAAWNESGERQRVRGSMAVAAVGAIFDWLASAAGRELLAVMNRCGLGRVQLGTSDARLLADGSIELYSFAKQWSACQTFVDAEDFVVQTAYHASRGRRITRFDEQVIEVAKLINDGTILDRIAEHLRKP